MPAWRPGSWQAFAPLTHFLLARTSYIFFSQWEICEIKRTRYKRLIWHLSPCGKTAHSTEEFLLPTKKRRSEAAGNERIGRKISPSCLILTPLGLSFEEFLQGVLEFYTPRKNGMLPAEMVIGHQTRSILPSHRKAFTDRWKAVIDACDRQNRHRRFHKNALWRPQQTLITFTNRGTGTHIESEI